MDEIEYSGTIRVDEQFLGVVGASIFPWSESRLLCLLRVECLCIRM